LKTLHKSEFKIGLYQTTNGFGRCSSAKIWYDIFVNCNWVVTRWQYTFTHKQYI